MPDTALSATDPSRLQRALADAIGAHAPAAGDYPTGWPGLTLFRRDAPSPPAECWVEPSVILVAQGAKQMWVGGAAYPYDASRFLLTSLGMPATGEVTVASAHTPCLGLALKLDFRMVTELVAQGGLPSPRLPCAGTSVGIGAAATALMSPFARLLDLLEEPQALPVLAPLIVREIHYRLLCSDQAERLRQIASVDSQGHRIAKAIDWLKLNFAQPLRVEDLATRVQMSVATFHHHFRQLTAMSPLQYQKWLRLNEAKRLMLNEQSDVASAAFKVGYESPSQFSREYSRLFGLPPKRDIGQARRPA